VKKGDDERTTALGLMGVTIDPEYGGAGADFISAVLLLSSRLLIIRVIGWYAKSQNLDIALMIPVRFILTICRYRPVMY